MFDSKLIENYYNSLENNILYDSDLDVELLKKICLLFIAHPRV